MNKLALMQEWLSYSKVGSARYDLAVFVNHPAIAEEAQLDAQYRDIPGYKALPSYRDKHRAIVQKINETGAQEWLDMGADLHVLGYEIYRGDTKTGVVLNRRVILDSDLHYEPLLDTPSGRRHLERVIKA